MAKWILLTALAALAGACGGDDDEPVAAFVTAECAAVTSAGSAQAAAPVTLRTVTVDNQERQYYEYAPSNVAALRENDARGVEVVISLHRNGQTAEENARLTQWHAVAEEKGFVVLFPVALEGRWNTSMDAGRANDLAFVAAAAAAARTRHGLPSTMSTFLTGAGEGGTMAQELAMRQLNVMATGVAAFGATAEAATLDVPRNALPRTAMAVWQFDCGGSSAQAAQLAKQVDFWRTANSTDTVSNTAVQTLETTSYSVASNPVQEVRVSKLGSPAESAEMSRLVWEQMFAKVVRFPDNKSYNGTLHPEQSISDMGLVETVKALGAGVPRRWLTYVPPQYAALVAEGKKLPLMFSFHGRNGSARFQAEISQWHEVAKAEGFVVVYPHGLGATWTTSIAADNVDVQFFLDLLAELKATYQIDEGRVFLNGSSQGTAMTNRIAVQYPQLLAAIAPCYSGHLSAASYGNAIVRSDVPLPVWQCRGEQELPSEFPGGTAGETASRLFWRETVNRNSGVPTLAVDGRRAVEIWNNGLAEYRWQVTADLGHAWHPGQARKMWDEMLKFYRRNPDGSLQRL